MTTGYVKVMKGITVRRKQILFLKETRGNTYIEMISLQHVTGDLRAIACSIYVQLLKEFSAGSFEFSQTRRVESLQSITEASH